MRIYRAHWGDTRAERQGDRRPNRIGSDIHQPHSVLAQSGGARGERSGWEFVQRQNMALKARLREAHGWVAFHSKTFSALATVSGLCPTPAKT